MDDITLRDLLMWLGGLFNLFSVFVLFGWYLSMCKLQKFLTGWEILLNKRSADLEKIAKELQALAPQSTTEETK